MTIYLIIIFLLAFILGWTIPSFLLVLKYRKEENQKNNWWSGRSYCNKCKTPLKWYNLIPIFSYLFQWWKCKNCWFKIPLQYLIYEIIWGIIMIIITYIIICSLQY